MNTSPPRKQTPNRLIIPATYPVILPSSRIGKDAYVGQCQKIAPAVSRATAAMVKQKKDGQDLGATGKHARVSDPIEIPLRPDQTNLLAMIGARAAMSRASLDAAHPRGHARKARRGRKSFPGLPFASKPVREPLFSVQPGGRPGSCLVRGGPRRSRSLRLSTVSGGAGEPSLLQHQAIRSTKMSHSTLSEPPPIILRHEAALFLSPLCDSHSKHVEKTRS